MEIKRAFCFYEQSGVFRDAFRSFGIPAECYDISDKFGQTDHITDLFNEVSKAFNDKPSIIDGITPEDLTIAFFPCIHFEQFACMTYQHFSNWMSGWSERKKTLNSAAKFDQCAIFYRRLWELIAVFCDRGLRLIIENPVNGYTLLNYLMPKPKYIDRDRTKMGDCYYKPTAYWFFNCDPEGGVIYEKPKKILNIEKTASNSTTGVCSIERSLITPEYARNFIAAKLLGNKKALKNQQLTLL